MFTPTEKKVLEVLAAEGRAMTGKDLLGKTGAGRRTLYLTTRNLVARGFLIMRDNLKDARQRIFGLTEAGRQAAVMA